MRLKHLLQISLAAAVINIALTPIASGVATYFGYLMIICFWSYALAWTGLNRSIKMSVLVLFLIIVLSLSTSAKYFDSEDLRKKIISIFTFLSFYWGLSLRPDSNDLNKIRFKYIYYSALALSLVFAVYAFAFPSIAYTPFGKYGELLFTMGMGNPNGTAVYVLFTAMVLLLALRYTRSKLKKAFLIAIIAVLAWILFLLRSRTVLTCFALATLCAIFLPLLKYKRIFRYLVLTAPIIMVIVQFALNDKIGDLEILGKSVDTGRFEMYRDLLEQIRNEPLQYIFGNICKNNFQNFHNGVLTIFASLGGVGVVWVLRLWNSFLRDIELTSKNKHQQLAYFFVLLFLLDSIAESMTMVGTLPQGLFVYLIVKIAKGDVAWDFDDNGGTIEQLHQEGGAYDRTSAG